MTTTWFIVARAVHFGACLLFFSFFAFDRFVAAKIFSGGENEVENYWRKQIRFFSLILLPLILLSGIFWFVLVAMTMSGESPTTEILKTVWTQTQFGTVWFWRSIFWLATTIFFAFSFRVRGHVRALERRDMSRRGKAATCRRTPNESAVQKIFTWLQLSFSSLLLGSLAWAGHGQETSRWHLGADVLHLLVAGFWPTGLLPLFLLFQKLRKTSEVVQIAAIIPLVRRFSILSLIAVALLSATGLINSWFLVGSFSDLFSQNYGRWLSVKILLFIFAISLGAVNLLRLKPRLAQSGNFSIASAQIRRNVFIELILAVAVIIIVAVLGILPPAIQ
jgi:putative copper resistance protein D